MQNTNGVKEIIKNGSLDQTFLDLYFDYEGLEKQRNRYVKAIEKFEHLYGAKEIEQFTGLLSANDHSFRQKGEIHMEELKLEETIQIIRMGKCWQVLLIWMRLQLLPKQKLHR